MADTVVAAGVWMIGLYQKTTCYMHLIKCLDPVPFIATFRRAQHDNKWMMIQPAKINYETIHSVCKKRILSHLAG